MQTVTLTRDLRPWRAGDSVPLADDVAQKLVDAGEATNPRPFPEGAKPEAAKAPSRLSRVGYLTRKAR